METPGVERLPTVWGLGALGQDADRRRRQDGHGTFADAWARQTDAEVEAEAGGGDALELQRGTPPSRRGHGDGEFHIDVLV